MTIYRKINVDDVDDDNDICSLSLSCVALTYTRLYYAIAEDSIDGLLSCTKFCINKSPKFLAMLLLCTAYV